MLEYTITCNFLVLFQYLFWVGLSLIYIHFRYEICLKLTRLSRCFYSLLLPYSFRSWVLPLALSCSLSFRLVVIGERTLGIILYHKESYIDFCFCMWCSKKLLLHLSSLATLPWISFTSIRHNFVDDIRWITDEELLRAGVTSGNDRKRILDAFHLYKKEKVINQDDSIPASAPTLLFEEASAPLLENIKTITSSECVVCLDMEVILSTTYLTLLCNLLILQCQIIFVPCGHLCCCCQCSFTISECPLCRTNIERKISVIL